MLSNRYLELDTFLGVPPWSEFACYNLEANSLHGVGLSPLALFCPAEKAEQKRSSNNGSIPHAGGEKRQLYLLMAQLR